MSRQAGSAQLLALAAAGLVAASAAALLLTREAATRRTIPLSRPVADRAHSALDVAWHRLPGMAGSGDLLARAAGPNDALDVDPRQLQAIEDGDGRLVGLAGYGDDLPLLDEREGDALALVFLTNDPLEGRSSTTDANGRLMLTAVAAGASGSVEVVQAILEPEELLPELPHEALTLLGPVPGHGRRLDPGWSDCRRLHELIEVLRERAAIAAAPGLTFLGAERAILTRGETGSGLLVATGALTLEQGASWRGLVLVLGRGELEVRGPAAVAIRGAAIVADIDGPDDAWGSADDCSGGPAGDGFGVPSYRVERDSVGTVQHAPDLLAPIHPVRAYRLVTLL